MTETLLKLRQIWLPNLKSVWAVTFGILALVALLDPVQLPATVGFALRALMSTGPYILIAIFLIGALLATGAQSTISKAFEGKEVRMIILASLFGGLAPFCSCEVIPFIAALLAAGTPISAVMAFWLASPIIDPPSLMITAGALGWEFAIGKMVAAVGIGLFGGFTVKLLADRFGLSTTLRQQKSCCGCGPDPLSGTPVWKFWTQNARIKIFFEAARDNGLFLLKWLSLAYVLESLMITYIPAQTIASFVGGSGLWPIMLSALLGAPAYLNSYAAPALVSGLVDQGMTLGAGMAFIVAGAVTSIPAMTAVFALVQRKIFAIYVLLGFSGAVLSGVLFGLVAG
ncbi:MAG: permease [Roseobacter sp.]